MSQAFDTCTSPQLKLKLRRKKRNKRVKICANSKHHHGSDFLCLNLMKYRCIWEVNWIGISFTSLVFLMEKHNICIPVESMSIVKGNIHTCRLDFGPQTAHHCISCKERAKVNIAGVKIELTLKEGAIIKN